MIEENPKSTRQVFADMYALLHKLTETAQEYAESDNYYAGFWELCKILEIKPEGDGDEVENLLHTLKEEHND